MVSAMGKTYTSTNHREYCASHVLIDAHSLLFAGDRPRMSSGWFATRMRMLCLSCPDHHGHHNTNRCICYSPVCCNRTGVSLSSACPTPPVLYLVLRVESSDIYGSSTAELGTGAGLLHGGATEPSQVNRGEKIVSI